MFVNIAIVEDEPVMQDRLDLQLQQWARLQNQTIKVSKFLTGSDFLKNARHQPYQIVFMDIYLGKENGIETALSYRKFEISNILIFLTSSRDHMHQAFPCRAFDYLLKPVEDQALFHMLNEAMRRIDPPEERLEITKGELQYAFRFSDIRYVISQRNYCLIQAGEAVRYRVTFGTLAEKLNRDPRFCLINRGIIVNLDWVAYFAHGECRMTDGKQFPLHSKKQTQLIQTLIDYRFKKRGDDLRRLH